MWDSVKNDYILFQRFSHGRKAKRRVDIHKVELVPAGLKPLRHRFQIVVDRLGEMPEIVADAEVPQVVEHGVLDHDGGNGLAVHAQQLTELLDDTLPSLPVHCRLQFHR